jgi:hypothetical protein
LPVPKQNWHNREVPQNDIRRILDHAHAHRYLVRIRAVNPSGYTVDIEGYVMALGEGSVRVRQDDPQRGQVHDILFEGILDIDRVHDA